MGKEIVLIKSIMRIENLTTPRSVFCYLAIGDLIVQWANAIGTYIKKLGSC